MIPLAVVGAGPCGIGVGVAARQAGLDAVLFDKGCITGTLVNYPVHMTFFSTAERLELGGVPFVSINDKPTRVEALKYYRRIVKHFELDARQYHEVVAVTGRRGDFRLRVRGPDGAEREERAASVVIATGYYDTPNRLGIPGETLPHVHHYYREGHAYFDQDCLVIGGGNSAVDVALDLYRCGARVTLVHFLDGLDAGVKPWVRPDVEARLAQGQIAARWRTRVTEIRRGEVVLRGEAGEAGAAAPPPERLRSDWVFAMTGYRPDPRLLQELGVTVDGRTGIPLHDPATMETDIPGVYIAGVIAAGNDANKIFIENGREHGPRIVAALRRNG
jgi:thioredoxin reductase (NADPH)